MENSAFSKIIFHFLSFHLRSGRQERVAQSSVPDLWSLNRSDSSRQDVGRDVNCLKVGDKTTFPVPIWNEPWSKHSSPCSSTEHFTCGTWTVTEVFYKCTETRRAWMFSYIRNVKKNGEMSKNLRAGPVDNIRKCTDNRWWKWTIAVHRLQTQNILLLGLIGHMLAKCLAPVQSRVTRTPVTRCFVPPVTSAQAALMPTDKIKGQVNQTRSWRQVRIEPEGKTGRQRERWQGHLSLSVLFQMSEDTGLDVQNEMKIRGLFW